jgi:Fe2+ or Zn2+ uptake regulation protein
MVDYTQELVELLFGKGRKTENLRQAASLILNELRVSNGSLPATELFAKVGKKKTFYKVLRPLKEVKLVRAWRDKSKKVYYQLEPKEFKGVFTNLAEKVAEELK